MCAGVGVSVGQGVCVGVGGCCGGEGGGLGGVEGVWAWEVRGRGREATHTQHPNAPVSQATCHSA